MRTPTLLMLTAVMLAFGGPVTAASEPSPLKGTFSNVCVHPESGDLLGLELSFIPAGNTGYVLLQRYEGEAVAPELMTLQRKGASTYLKGPDGAEVVSLREKGATVVVTWNYGSQASSGGRTETLARSPAVWNGRKVPVCE